MDLIQIQNKDDGACQMAQPCLIGKLSLYPVSYFPICTAIKLHPAEGILYLATPSPGHCLLPVEKGITLSSFLNLPSSKNLFGSNLCGSLQVSSPCVGVFSSAKQVDQNSAYWIVFLLMYRAGRPICRKVLKIMCWEFPPANWLIL